MNDDEFVKITRDYWKITPISNLKDKITIKRTFTREEFEKIQLGHFPKDMDDKWFLFFEDDWLFFHRSWSGVCVY